MSEEQNQQAQIVDEHINRASIDDQVQANVGNGVSDQQDLSVGRDERIQEDQQPNGIHNDAEDSHQTHSHLPQNEANQAVDVQLESNQNVQEQDQPMEEVKYQRGPEDLINIQNLNGQAADQVIQEEEAEMMQESKQDQQDIIQQENQNINQDQNNDQNGGHMVDDQQIDQEYENQENISKEQNNQYLNGDEVKPDQNQEMIVDQQQQYQNYLQHVDNSQNRGNDPESDDEGVISTSAKPNNASSTPHASKHGSANNNNSAPANNNSGTMGAQQKQPTTTGSGSMQGIQGSSVAPSSYHMQQNLQISAQITKQIMDAVKKGDVNLVKQEQEKLGISIKYIMEENLKHNAIFQGTLIKDHAQAQKMVEYLISEGVDPCTSDSLSQTPLFYASREGNVNLVEIFVKNGCLPNHLDAYGQTSIFYAAREGHLEVCKKLALLGADCDLVDHNGQTPIYYAVRGRKIDTVEFLIQQRADVNHEDKKQQTPMIIARRSNAQQIISLLIKNGAKTLEDLRQQSKQKKQAAVTQQQQQEVVIQQPTPQLPSNLAKKNPPAATSEKKQQKRYVLTVLKDGAWEPISIEEMDKFEQMYPEIAKFWKDPSSLEKLQLPKFPENAPIYESWDKAAKRLMNSIWKFNQSWIFHEPVDPERLGVPDYFNIIRNPMDFGTIKQRLNTNYYHRMQEFLDDMQLVFDNCLKFNGEENNIGKICKIVREEFKRLYEQLNIEFYLN